MFSLKLIYHIIKNRITEIHENYLQKKYLFVTKYNSLLYIKI